MKGSRKKTVLKIVLFCGIFAALWYAFQYVLAYNWNRGEHMESRYRAYEAEPDNSIDVVMIGASNIFADLAPAVLWHEAGITAYNMGTSRNIPVLYYHQLRYLIRVQKPRLVVIDAVGLSMESDLEGRADKYEYSFRKIADTMPDMEIKMDIIREAKRIYPDQDPRSYLFPLLRYHDRWEELEEEDFRHSLTEEEYLDHTKGSHINTRIAPQEWKEDMFTYDEAPADMYEDYLQRTVDLCKENDIDVLLVLFPRITSRYGDYETAKTVAERNGLEFLSFSTQESFGEAGLDIRTDYYDSNHLNLLGQRSFSVFFADYLNSHFDLPAHDEEMVCREWDAVYREYEAYYDEHKDSMELVE